MINKDIYPCSVDKLDTLLIKHNYDINKEKIWKDIIHDKYCVHIEFHRNGEKNVCRRLKINGSELCKRHTPKDPKDIRLCDHNDCKRKVKNDNNKCIYHRTLLLKEIPFFKEKDINWLQFNSSLKKYKIKYINKNIGRKIISKNNIDINMNNHPIQPIYETNNVSEMKVKKRCKINGLSKNDTKMTILPKNNFFKKQIIYFGSLEFIVENIHNENNIIPFKYRKKVKRKFLSMPSLTFPSRMQFSKNIKIGEIKIDTINDIKRRILFKIKSLIFFKKLYLFVKDKNINNIYDEPIEYYSENVNQLSQTKRTASYLFDDINYIQKIYTYFDFLIKSFENKYGPPPGDAKKMINHIINLFKYPDFNILN